jgi:hypothetical protein
MACKWRRWIMQMRTHCDALTAPSRPCWLLQNYRSSPASKFTCSDQDVRRSCFRDDCLEALRAAVQHKEALHGGSLLSIDRQIHAMCLANLQNVLLLLFKQTTSLRRHGACCMPTTATQRASQPGVRLAQLSSQKRQCTQDPENKGALWGRVVCE